MRFMHCDRRLTTVLLKCAAKIATLGRLCWKAFRAGQDCNLFLRALAF